jgi:hypothetical protein
MNDDATNQTTGLGRVEAAESLVVATEHTLDEALLIVAALENANVHLVRGNIPIVGMSPMPTQTTEATIGWAKPEVARFVGQHDMTRCWLGWAIDQPGRKLFVEYGVSENDAWKFALGWPDAEEIAHAKANGSRAFQVSIVERIV